ncbi:carbohydrate kinase [Georgenia wutianyii]|uniref:ATP:glycerol 3-phosphotransferase n=1 Tax=Georgenia wutianyii TaxID=2585135 RepID=A0ABX5VSE5_9MICO|nr:FGGY family carbohydrate kinase [Georgenia wutianyii]QDB79630.1 carbohydrate kinase [Georgenia wutianyii]
MCRWRCWASTCHVLLVRREPHKNPRYLIGSPHAHRLLHIRLVRNGSRPGRPRWRQKGCAVAILALDQGTSGSKAIVVDEDGIHAVVENPIHPQYLPGGAVEQDPIELYRSVVEAGTEAVAKAGKPIEGVSLANQGETILAWDPETGEPLTQCIVWQDRRSEVVVERLREHAEEIHQRTGLVLDSYFTAPKMVWLRENCTREGVVTTTDTWMLHRLTGEFVTDVSTASRSLLFNVDDVAWDPRLIEIFGLQDERLPRAVACDEIVGMTTVFGGEIPVGGLIVDQQAALFAERCLERGQAKCTYGTGAFILVNMGDSAPRFDNGLTTSVAWQLRGRTTYCSDGQVYTAASAVRWMQEMGIVEGAAEMDQIAAPDPGGVICAPSFAGLAAPWWKPDAGAFIAGMKLATGKPEIVRAVLDGIACQIAELSDLTREELGAPLTRLRVDGGLTKSVTLMQSQADMLQAPIETYPSAHATALGTAACMRLALDPELAVEDGPYEWEAEASYEPRRTAADVTVYRTAWRNAVDATLEI